MTTSRGPSRHRRPWLVAILASASVLVPVAGARATWQTSNVTVLEFRDVCRDGIRFGGAVSAETNHTEPQYNGTAIAVQPPPANWEVWTGRAGQVMRWPIKIPRAAAGTTVDLEGQPLEVSHRGSYTMPYQDGPLPLAPVALNLQDGLAESNLNTATVTDCYLYAPIDIQPGASPNKVPIGHGDVFVAVLTTETLRADQLDTRKFRFGPKKAPPKGSALRDVNKDRRKDLVLRFGSVAAGLKCSTSKVSLTGETPSGGKLEASGSVVPTGC